MVKSAVGKNNLSPRSKRSVTWSAHLIQRGGQDVYDCLRFDSDAYVNLHRVRVTSEVKGSKRKGFKFFDKFFYSSEQAKCWDVRLTIKLLIHIQKSAWLKACSCALTGASSWLLVRHLNFFLRESRKAAARWEHCMLRVCLKFCVFLPTSSLPVYQNAHCK